MILTDEIARFIDEMLTREGGRLEISRNDLAGRIGCVPSQINYVITSRLTPERGYIIESRRGGGGYIRIIKKQFQKNEYLMHFYHAIGTSLDTDSAAAYIRNLSENNIVTAREASIISAAVSACVSDEMRAELMRKVTVALM